MKTLDCRHVIDGIDDTDRKIDTLKEQVGEIQRAVKDFYSLDDVLKGKMGESVRNFFQNVHEPLLIYLHQSLIDYQNTLDDMKDHVETFESNESGFVRQAFLEEDMGDGFDYVGKRTTELTEDANNILERVQDIVSLKKIDDSEVLENVDKGKKKADNIVEKLIELDDQETSNLKKTKEDLKEMKSYLSDMKSGLKNGDLSVKDFDLQSVTGMDSYKSVVNDIYGEGYVEGKEMEPILDKMLNGENLTGDERDKLYDYFQNEYLDDASKQEVESIADSVNEGGVDDLKERLNEKVLESKDTLEDEMLMVQAYVYMGDKESKDVDIGLNTKQKLESYLLLLQDYHTGIQYQSVGGRDEISKNIESLQYKNQNNGISGHFFESTLKTETIDSKYNPASDDPVNRVEPPMNEFYYQESEVEYYTTSKSADLYQHLENKKLVDKRANYTSNFIKNFIAEEVMGKVISSIKEPYGTTLDVALKWTEYGPGKRELDEDLTIGTAKEYAGMLGMEFAVSQSHTAPGKAVNYDTKAQLYPTQDSYEILNRWEEVYEYNQDIPYPKDAIKAQNWEEIGKHLSELDREIHGDDRQNLYNYITSNYNNSYKSLEELADNY